MAKKDHQTPQAKIKIGQHEPYQTIGMNTDAPEG